MSEGQATAHSKRAGPGASQPRKPSLAEMRAQAMAPRGGPRSPTAIALGGLASFGIVYAWYYFVAFRELDFARGRRHSGLILLGLLPLAGPFFLMAYVSRELGGLARDRAGLKLAPPIKAWHHNLLVALGCIPGSLLLVAAGVRDHTGILVVALLLMTWAPVVVVARVATDINGAWRALGVHARPSPDADPSS